MFPAGPLCHIVPRWEATETFRVTFWIFQDINIAIRDSQTLTSEHRVSESADLLFSVPSVRRSSHGVG